MPCQATSLRPGAAIVSIIEMCKQSSSSQSWHNVNYLAAPRKTDSYDCLFYHKANSVQSLTCSISYTRGSFP